MRGSSRRNPASALITAAFVAIGLQPARAGMRIVSDERVELLALVQRLSGDDSLGAVASSGPEDAILKRFSHYRGSRAVTLLKAMKRGGFTDGLPTQYAVYLSTAPGLREEYPVPDMFISAAGSREALDDFRRALAGFESASGFRKWFASQSRDRESLRAALQGALEGKDLESPVAAYVGARTWNDIIVVVSPLLPAGAHSAWVLEDEPGLPDVYVMTGPVSWTRGEPDFGPVEATAAAIWPEVLYSAVYVLWDRCPQLDGSPDLCEQGGSRGAPPTTEFCVQRLWVDALLRRLSLGLFDQPLAAGGISKADAGVTKRLDAAFESYEKDRHGYPTLFDDAQALAAPMSRTGNPGCRAVDWSRDNRVYAKRLGIFLDQWIQRAPNAAAFKDRAQLRANEGDSAGAEQDARRSVDLDPTDYEAWDYLGVLAQRRGAATDAAAAYDRAVRLADSAVGVDAGLLADILSSRASLKSAGGDAAAAAADWTRALKVAPVAWPHRAEVERALGRKPADGTPP